MSRWLFLRRFLRLLFFDSLMQSCCGAANIRILASCPLVFCDSTQEAGGQNAGHGQWERLDKVEHKLEEGGALAVEDACGGEAVLESAEYSVLCNIALVNRRHQSILRTADQNLTY